MATYSSFNKASDLQFKCIFVQPNPEEGKARFTYAPYENFSENSPNVLSFKKAALDYGLDVFIYRNRSGWLEMNFIGDHQKLSDFHKEQFYPLTDTPILH